MRAALAIALLSSGCLAVPPDFSKDPEVTADAGSDDSLGGCVPGSTLDLVYVDAVTMAPVTDTEVVVPGLAVLANPGEDTVQLSGVSAALGDVDPDVAASVALDGGDSLLALAPGEAKGALAPDVAVLVRAELSETWADDSRPSLSAGFAAPGKELLDTDEVAIGLQVSAGGYRFDLAVRLVATSGSPPGLALSAARVTATCP